MTKNLFKKLKGYEFPNFSTSQSYLNFASFHENFIQNLIKKRNFQSKITKQNMFNEPKEFTIKTP